MAVRDLQAFFDDDGLDYPLPASAFEVKAGETPRFPDGKTYRVPSPSAKTGLWLTAIADLGIKAARGGELSSGDIDSLQLNDEQEESLYRRVLGPVYQEMIADGVKYSWLQRVGQDAYLCFALSSEVADRALTSLGKASPNRAERRAAAKTAGRRSSRGSTGTTGSARATASRTSGSSTSQKGRGGARAV